MHIFRIEAICDPQSLPRIAGFFAQRAITPSAMRMVQGEETMQIEVTVASLAPRQAEIISAKLDGLFAVTGATVAPVLTAVS